MNRIQYLALSLICFGLVAFALTLQQFGYQEVSFLPCPLCILQRAGYLGVAISCLLAAGIPSLRKVFHGIAILAAGYGAAVAGHHVWLLSHPTESCGIDPLEVWINQFQLANVMPWLFKADGLCSAKLPAILGLQVPEWSLAWFCIILLILLASFFRRSRA